MWHITIGVGGLAVKLLIVSQAHAGSSRPSPRRELITKWSISMGSTFPGGGAIGDGGSAFIGGGTANIFGSEKDYGW